MNYRILSLVGLTLAATFIMMLVYWLAEGPTIKNDFNRLLARGEIELISATNLESNGYYFAGFDHHKLYLGISQVPLHLLEIQDTNRRTVSIQGKFDPPVHSSVISIAPPSFLLADIASYTIYKGELNDWRIDTVVHSQDFFAETLTISPHSVILRSFNKNRSEYILSKETTWPFQKKLFQGLLEKQIDGLFCVDGMLQFDSLTRRIIYTYFYRNQFICADTSLNLLYRGRTIDTVSKAAIKVSAISSMNASTLSSPPKMVNRKSFTTNGKLYILSNLQADNEDRNTFQASYVFDIYDIQTGYYEHSFYVPKIEGKRLRHFIIRQDQIYVLSGTYLNIYKMNFQKPLIIL